jgi:hypothetical protein
MRCDARRCDRRKGGRLRLLRLLQRQGPNIGRAGCTGPRCAPPRFCCCVVQKHVRSQVPVQEITWWIPRYRGTSGARAPKMLRPCRGGQWILMLEGSPPSRPGPSLSADRSRRTGVNDRGDPCRQCASCATWNVPSANVIAPSHQQNRSTAGRYVSPPPGISLRRHVRHVPAQPSCVFIHSR